MISKEEQLKKQQDAKAKESREIPGLIEEEVARQNRDAMAKIMLETGILIRPLEYGKWRPTVKTVGDIPGIPCTVVCIATDGNLGIFEPRTKEGHSLGNAFVGHVHRFQWMSPQGKTGAPGPLFSVPPADKPGHVIKVKKAPDPKTLTKRQILKQVLADL